MSEGWNCRTHHKGNGCRGGGDWQTLQRLTSDRWSSATRRCTGVSRTPCSVRTAGCPSGWTRRTGRTAREGRLKCKTLHSAKLNEPPHDFGQKSPSNSPVSFQTCRVYYSKVLFFDTPKPTSWQFRSNQLQQTEPSQQTTEEINSDLVQQHKATGQGRWAESRRGLTVWSGTNSRGWSAWDAPPEPWGTSV